MSKQAILIQVAFIAAWLPLSSWLVWWAHKDTIQRIYGEWKYGEEKWREAVHMSNYNYTEALRILHECRHAHLDGDCDLCGRE